MIRFLSAGVAALAVALLALGSPGESRAEQPVQLWLPWEGGTLWTYTQGPHGDGVEALDFQPPDAAGKPCDYFRSSFWVTAAAPGKVTEIANGVEIDHGGGFSTTYYHLENKQVKTGDSVQTGDRLGAPSCCPDGSGSDGCWSTAPHVHFYALMYGARLPAFGLNLGGWVVNDDGCLARPGERSCPLEGGATAAGSIRAGSAGGRIVSNSPRRGQDDPSTPADIAVMIDASTEAEARTDAALAILQATRPDDRISVVRFNGKARVSVPLTEAVKDGSVNGELADALAAPTEKGDKNIRLGMVTGCAELLVNGKAPAKAAVLFTDGNQTAESMSGATECFAEAGIPVFVYGLGAADEEFLADIAADTGGQMETLSSISNPYCEFRRVRSIISGDPVGACTTMQLKKGEALTLPYNVPRAQDQAVMEIRWRERSSALREPQDERESRVLREPPVDPGLLVEATIVSPNGKVLKMPYTGIKYEEVDGSARFTISYPTAGEWKLVVNLKDTAPDEGLFITFSASTVPQVLPFVALGPEPEADGETQGPRFATPTPSATPEYTGSVTPTPTPDPMSLPTPVEEPTRTPRPTLEVTAEPTPAATG